MMMERAFRDRPGGSLRQFVSSGAAAGLWKQRWSILNKTLRDTPSAPRGRCVTFHPVHSQKSCNCSLGARKLAAESWMGGFAAKPAVFQATWYIAAICSA